MSRIIFLLFASISLGLQSCDDVNAKATIDPVTPIDTSVTDRKPAAKLDQLQATVDQLSIREIPGQDGKLLGHIAVGEAVSYLGEETDFKDRIKLREKTRYATWKKVSYPADSEDPIIGWAYGGGLQNTAAIYQHLDADTYVRKLEAVSSAELTRLLSFDVPDDLYFDGSVRYLRLSDGTYVPDGKFLVTASKRLPDMPDYVGPAMFEVSGTYTRGRKNGIFELQYQLYETNSVFTILFDQDACDWFSVIGSSEGESFSIREDNPVACTIKYMGERMKAKY